MTPPAAPLAPLAGTPTVDAVLDKFLAVAAAKGLSLYAEQEEAILELFGGKNVILATPTGSGKSLVAAALHFKALCAGERSVYTCPIKALVNEKFLALCRDFGPENVGMMTGDASVNLDAPVLSRYEMLFSRRAGIAVTEAKGGTCQGCRMRLPPQLYNEIQKHLQVHFCPNCMRILYFETPLKE